MGLLPVRISYGVCVLYRYRVYIVRPWFASHRTLKPGDECMQSQSFVIKGSLISEIFAYSEVPNRRADRNKQADWHFLKKHKRAYYSMDKIAGLVAFGSKYWIIWKWIQRKIHERKSLHPSPLLYSPKTSFFFLNGLSSLWITQPNVPKATKQASQPNE